MVDADIEPFAREGFSKLGRLSRNGKLIAYVSRRKYLIAKVAQGASCV